MFDDDDHECDEYLDARFSPWDIVLAATTFMNGVGQSFCNATEIIVKASIAASNRQMRQQDFAEAAHREIESIPVTEGEDG